MVLVVPVVSALVLGVLRVQTDVALANSYSETERVAALRTQFVSVLSAIQHERSESVRAGGEVASAADETDRAVDAMSEVVRRNPELGDPATGFAAVNRALQQLPAARRQLTTNAPGMVVLSAYNAVVNTVLEFDRSLVGRFPDENLAGTSIALGELLGMREQVALEQAIGNLALRDRALPEAGRQLLVEADVRFDDKVDNFRSQAPPALVTRYDDVIQDGKITELQQLVDAVRTTDPAGLPFTREQWESASNATSKVMADLTRQAAANLSRDSAALADSISDRAGLESVLLLTMVLLAAGIGGGLGRYLLRSVGQLRRTALDVANNRLPAAVEAIRAGEGAKVSVDPVPLQSTEEFGQLARAFDAVHGQAVRSAAEEASLRSNLANIFTNLSRRSQGLVERQLRLMEQLEQKTEDPDQLENLFKIDHLATRMRRNNENLMVLSGTGLLRRFTEPMPLPDVLRAAISEVEHYQRAVVRSVPEVRIAGYAAGDLIRSVSELIENATAFSPPDAQVSVVSRLLQDGSAVIDILDQGVGLGEKELREANQRITGGGGVDVPISRQMGLFVVGRLTSRHGIHVRLIPRSEGGVCASVLVPAGLVNISDPGATAALELPVPGQGPATATEWLVSAEPPADWVDTPSLPATWLDTPSKPMMPAVAQAPSSWLDSPSRGSSWLTSAGGGSAGGRAATDRSTAISWLTAAKKADAAIPTAAGETPTPAAPETASAGVGTPPAGIAIPMGTPPAGIPLPGGTDSGALGSPGTPPAGIPAPTGAPGSMGTPPAGMPSLAGAAASGGTTTGPAGSPPAENPSAAGVSGPGAEPAETPEVTASAVGVDPPTLAGISAVLEGPALKPGASSLPAEKFEPVEVAGKLESAGIVVSLPVLPDAATPASILFADNTMGAVKGSEPDFSWLRAKSAATKAAAPAAPIVTTGPAGLPKRVPRGQGKGPEQQPPAATRNAARARGFMSDFQAGIRQSEHREGDSGS